MSQSFTDILKTLAKNVMEDHEIDTGEIAALKAMIIEDGAVDNHEASQIFELQEHFASSPYSEAFAEFFIDGITSFLLYSGETPGSLDTQEWIWLLDQIADDGRYTELEKALLRNIAMKAENLPENFQEKVNKL